MGIFFLLFFQKILFNKLTLGFLTVYCTDTGEIGFQAFEIQVRENNSLLFLQH
jgi:hypothetical protein